ncbi:hypothetical protein VT84_04365 [Gemmata sp. SH-PL17]|uniref:hypothetical protein n=1 Tax=Gemmata sp. SH-PL17 TaxID=1630693 RepID=UPI00078E0B82|nr:hypothetical protein [Gemmata sp. SH-PL17]AMV23621.1 hypothetical protein VT84_04365 [Gemmata sp. SH-PL17]
MAEAERVQSHPARDTGAVVVMFSVLAATNGVLSLFDPAQMNPQHPAIQETAFGVVIGWVTGFSLAFARRRWEPATIFVRAIYTWGCAMCVLHIVVAFHLAHGWSHEVAWEHTREVGGYGNGIFVNYAFALVWFADVVWAWVAFDSYLSRPRWITWAVYGFTGFVVFNASVVFNTGFTRAVCALLFIALARITWNDWRTRGYSQQEANAEDRGGSEAQ